MASGPSIHAPFPRFPCLATELRNQIWEEALPHDGVPVLVLYKTECLELELRDSHEPNMGYVKLNHDLLNAANLDFSLAFVSREAHSIAVAWFRA